MFDFLTKILLYRLELNPKQATPWTQKHKLGKHQYALGLNSNRHRPQTVKISPKRKKLRKSSFLQRVSEEIFYQTL